MAYKQSKHLFQGMSRDLSEDKQKGVYYIDAHNIRITAREDTTLLSVTNEKGNKLLSINYEGNYSSLGRYIGHAVLNNYLVLFTVDSNHFSNIWRVDFSNTSNVTAKLLYKGDLGFSYDNPIETLADYETDSIQKVYWTDGINQPRVINIVSDDIKPNVDTQFDFIPEVYPNGTNDTLQIKIDKVSDTTGQFKSGTIQYFVSYYNKFGQESNIVWQSPLLYISPLERGGNVSETVNNAFRITIDNPASTFDYIRIYAVQHTSEDTDLIGRFIVDLAIDTTDPSITFIDNGVLGEAINPSELYYKGGVPTVIGTMAAKDQTLFLGNITLKNKQKLPDTIKNAIRNLKVTFNTLPAYPAEDADGKLYDYDNTLNENNQKEFSNNNAVTATHAVTTYKYLEEYRFGLQFQDKYGRWSEPMFIADVVNDEHPKIMQNAVNIPYVYLPTASITLGTELILALKDLGYVKVRPLVVLPTENERECVAQGVLCPTVFNKKDREDNSPYAQPSWFFRAYPPSSLSSDDIDNINATLDHKYGNIIPYQHNDSIRGNGTLGEIESAPSTSNSPFKVSNSQVDLPDSLFFIDQSIVTLNSPDIEFNDFTVNEDFSNYKIRIVGAISLSGVSGELYLDVAAPNTYYIWDNVAHSPTAGRKLIGQLKKPLYTLNYSDTDGWKLMTNGPYYADVPYKAWGIPDEYTPASYMLMPSNIAYGYWIYPWQSEGSITGCPVKVDPFNIDNTSVVTNLYDQTSVLNRKIYANLRYSNKTSYLNTSDILKQKYTTTDIQTVDADLKDTVRLRVVDSNQHRSHYSNTDYITYYSKVDKLLPTEEVEGTISQNSYTFTNGHTTRGYEDTLYDFNCQRRSNAYVSGLKDVFKKYASTHITYNSTRHAVISLQDFSADSGEPAGQGETLLPKINSVGKPKGKTGTGAQTIDWQQLVNPAHFAIQRQYYYNSSSQFTYVCQDNININAFSDYGTLLIGEIYRPEGTITNKYGGKSDSALQQNTWIPAGESVTLNPKNTIYWTEGDTYYQRYDCLKTYPYSNESTNSIVEILSFMCESRINIAGRYDKNRGLEDNTFITNENFNLINKGYTQKDNFFSYKMLDERFNVEHFKAQITWTKTKSVSALIDNWTNVTLQNTLDLDGDKGELVSLNKYNNDIIAFQPKGISQIIYNPNVQVSNSAGLPVELANSGRVQGKRYLFENIGCQNKWSICDEVSGALFFIDNYSKAIYRIGSNGISSLTEVKGFKEWMNTQNTIQTWVPYDYSSTAKSRAFRTFYDKIFKDVYFVNGVTCLVYSELLEQFVSFMDYSNTNAMFNIGDNFYALYGDLDSSAVKVYQQFAGNYNVIYDMTKDYYITFIDNMNPEYNKIYTNLEYRSDTYINGALQSDKTFDTIRVYNEYQNTGNIAISTVLDRPYLSRLQKKFRVWRIQLPRDAANPMNRINNTWTKISLRKTHPTINEKTVLHDAIVGYYI